MKALSTAAAALRSSIHLRAQLAPGIAIGPGKADLLEGIRDTGSIAAAGRRMHMSYRRAWQLIEELNRSFREPLVESSKGGAGGGGARLTRLGETVLDRYAHMRSAASTAVAADVTALRRLVARDD
jgi:molybdate transport system regulatory protein